MSDPNRIDGHKLHLHPARVAAWLAARGDWERERAIYPIYLEVSPADACNHRCGFCGLDFARNNGRRLDPALLAARLAEAAALGVRSVMFAGEGEPLLYRALPATLRRAADAGLDLALTSNLVPLTEEAAEAVLDTCRWIKASVNGGDAATYAAVHGCPPTDFERLLGNMRLLSERRARTGSRCTLGAQLVLLPENEGSVPALAALVREAGFDYLVVKPYSPHPGSANARYGDLVCTGSGSLEARLAAEERPGFRVIFRREAMARAREEAAERPSVCGAVPFFWAYIDSGGGLWACS